MRKAGRGRIVAIGSRLAVEPAPGVAAYAASKAALVSLVRSAALENRDAGITANAILPGTIDTRSNRTWGIAGGSREMGVARRHRRIRGLPASPTPPPRSPARRFRCTEAWRCGIRLLCSCAPGLPCAAQSGIEAIFAPLADAKAPGAAVLVIKSGRLFTNVGSAFATCKSVSKIGDGTDFRLASCTKQFTAMAIMLLVHDRKLRYEDRLTDIFPDFPEYGRAITIRHLLTHTSGLPDYEDLMDKSWTPDSSDPGPGRVRAAEAAEERQIRARRAVGRTAIPAMSCSD